MNKLFTFYLGVIAGIIIMKFIPSLTWAGIAIYAVLLGIFSHDRVSDVFMTILLPTIIIDGIVQICMGYNTTWLNILLIIYLSIVWVYQLTKYKGLLTIDENDITIFPPDQIHI